MRTLHAGSKRRARYLVAGALGPVLLLALAWLVGCTPPPLVVPRYRVVLVADTQERTIDTTATTVKDLLAEAGVALGELDRVTPPEVAALTDGMTIRVVRVVQTTMVTTQTVPFERQVVRDATVEAGTSRLLQAGQPGLLERHYRITSEDGEEIERALIREAMVQTPRDEIRLVGTKAQLHNVPITGTLAYLSHQDAWAIRGSSFQRKRLTHLGDLDGRVFALSPDGERLLFTRTSTETEHLNELWLIVTTLASADPLPLGIYDVVWADWAPDGERIAWSTAETTETAPGWRGNNDLWRATLSVQQTPFSRRQILEPEAGGGYGWWGTRYAWAPDGERLAFSHAEGIGIVDMDEAERVTHLRFPPFRTFSSWAWHPAVTWSPDGAFLLGVDHADDGSDKPEESPIFNLIALDSAGAYSATLALEVGMWAAPVASPDGTSTLFGRAVVPYQSATSRYTLHLIDRDGSNQRSLYAGENNSGLEIPEWTWSPDGKAIAFVELGNVYVLPLEAASPEVLTDEGGITQIRWR